MNRRTLIFMTLTSSCSLLMILFLVLRLAGVISWPWPLIFAPIGFPLAILGLVFAGLAILDRVE